MQLFSNKHCEKCRGANPKLQYCDGKSARFPSPCVKQDIKGEHIHKICTSCGYEWLETTAKEADVVRLKHKNHILEMEIPAP